MYTYMRLSGAQMKKKKASRMRRRRKKQRKKKEARNSNAKAFKTKRVWTRFGHTEMLQDGIGSSGPSSRFPRLKGPSIGTLCMVEVLARQVPTKFLPP